MKGSCQSYDNLIDSVGYNSFIVRRHKIILIIVIIPRTKVIVLVRKILKVINKSKGLKF